MTGEAAGKAPGTGAARAVGATVSLDKIDAGVKPVIEKRGKDSKDKQEEVAFTAARHRAETASIVESNRDLRVNRRMRYDYAKAVFKYLIWYSAFAGVVIAP